MLFCMILYFNLHTYLSNINIYCRHNFQPPFISYDPKQFSSYWLRLCPICHVILITAIQFIHISIYIVRNVCFSFRMPVRTGLCHPPYSTVWLYTYIYIHITLLTWTNKEHRWYLDTAVNMFILKLYKIIWHI